MFNKLETIPFNKLFLISLLLLALPLAACGTLADSAAAAPTEQKTLIAPGESTGVASFETAAPTAGTAAVEVTQNTDDINLATGMATTAGLSVDEIADLLFMREEEKLARDVYLALYDLWGIPVFQNIAASEQVHMDALLSLINQYGLEDPLTSNGAGVFTDPTLQTLYDQLITTGSQSAVEALLVGATVEEIDILDLQGSLAQTHRDDIVPVYHNLLAGSENHLRSFISLWERQTGETYRSQHISENEFADIMGNSQGGNGQGQSVNGQGQGGNSQGQGGNNGRGQGGSGGGQGQGGNGSRGGQGGQGKGRTGSGSQGQELAIGN